MRIRIGSARTAAWLSENTRETDPTFPQCDQEEHILHALVHCPGHDAVRRQYLPELLDKPATTLNSVDVLFPTRSKKPCPQMEQYS